jgi:hypothetical protein
VDASQKAEIAVKYRDELKAKMKADDVAEAKKIYDSKKKADPAAPAAATDAPAAKSKGSSKSK